MKKIELSQGFFALVDDDIFEELNQFKWCAHKDCNVYYAVRHLPRDGKKRHTIRMHHEIIGRPPKGFETDHRNGQGLDNQRHNLRHITHRQNCQNRKNGCKSSQYPGICWDKERERWRADIQINGKSKFLGRFSDEYEAFEVYRQAIKNLDETVMENY